MGRIFSIALSGRILGCALWGIVPVAAIAQACSDFNQPWAALFSEERITFRVNTEMPVDDWSLVLSGAVVARGRGATMDVAFPPLRDGLAVAGAIEVQDSAGASKKPIWLFSRKPLFPALSNLMVYDPIGSTTPILASNAISHQPIARIEALSQVTNGVLLVGAGISLDEAKGLSPVLFDAAARGVRILWLEPKPGRMKLPGDDKPSPAVMNFRSTAVISATDKRLRAEDWRCTNAVASSFHLVGDRRLVELEWSGPGGPWCWLDASWPSGGRLVVCGVSIVDSWENNPAPRYLLAQWLTDLSKTE